MSYKALYRKYRPQTFAEVVGQAATVKTLQNAILTGKITHAYLFSGPRGTGKTTIARIFAKALNCANPHNGEPCGECVSCKEISESMNPDVIEIDAASNNGVDEIRDIREKVKFLPSGAKYKVYIIDEVHMLSTGAFNALLKTLEEPPKHVIFILATTEPQKLPATIISRCQRYDFKSLGTFEISMQLKHICDCEDTTISDDAINAISEAAEGGMRDALSILDQVISYGNKDVTIDDVNTITGTISYDKMNLLMNYIETKNINSALDMVNSMLQSGKEVNKILSAMLVFCRDILLYKSIGSKNNSKYIFEKENFQELALKLATNKVMYYIDVLCDALNKIRVSTTPSVYLEITIIKLCSIYDDTLNLMDRMKKVEEKVENVDFSNADANGATSEVDNEKLNMLDAKINQVVNEFNKLELYKLTQRIDDLSQMVNNNETENGGMDYSSEIAQLHLDIENLKNDNLVSADSSRIDSLENEIKEIKDTKKEDNSYEINQRLSMLDNEIQKIKSFENNKVVSTDNFEYDELNNKLVELEQKLNNLSINNNNFDIDKEEISNEVKKLMANYEDLNNNETVDIVKGLQRQVNDLYSYINKMKPQASASNSDLVEIKEKLETLESRMYKFIANAISSSKPKEKAEKKANGQIMLWGDEIKSLDDIDKFTTEDVDFSDLKQEEDVEAENESFENKLEEQENIYEETVQENTEKIEENKEDIQEEIVQEQSIEENKEEFSQQEELFASDVVEKPSLVHEERYQNVSLFDTDNDKEDSNVDGSSDVEVIEQDARDGGSNYIAEENEADDIEDDQIINEEFKEEDKQISFEDYQALNSEDNVSLVEKDVIDNKEFSEEDNFNQPKEAEKPKVVDEVIERRYNEDRKESVVYRTNSSTVIRDSDVKDDISVSESLLRQESERHRNIVRSEDVSTPQQEEIIVKKPVEQVDKFIKYNVDDLSQLLLDSQSTACRNDKERLVEMWKTLTRGVNPELIPVASLLSEGNITAVGNKEFVLVFKSVSQCNQVMRNRFKHEAIKLLYEKLGDSYNYLALPQDVWMQKRQEYIGQYQIGIKKPQLTPFNIPGLNIMSDNDEYKNNDEKLINNTLKMFGDDIVNINKR